MADLRKAIQRRLKAKQAEKYWAENKNKQYRRNSCCSLLEWWRGKKHMNLQTKLPFRCAAHGQKNQINVAILLLKFERGLKNNEHFVQIRCGKIRDGFYSAIHAIIMWAPQRNENIVHKIRSFHWALKCLNKTGRENIAKNTICPPKQSFNVLTTLVTCQTDSKNSAKPDDWFWISNLEFR